MGLLRLVVAASLAERNMPQEIVIATDAAGRQIRFVLDVFHEGEHWTSTLARLNEQGVAEGSRVAPRFYGLTADAARRKMLSVLENQYEQIQAAADESA